MKVKGVAMILKEKGKYVRIIILKRSQCKGLNYFLGLLSELWLICILI